MSPMASGFCIGQRGPSEMAFSALSASTRFSSPGAPIHDFSFHAVMPSRGCPHVTWQWVGRRSAAVAFAGPTTPCARVKGPENTEGFGEVLLTLTQCSVPGSQPQRGGLTVWKQRSGFGEVTVPGIEGLSIIELYYRISQIYYFLSNFFLLFILSAHWAHLRNAHTKGIGSGNFLRPCPVCGTAP